MSACVICRGEGAIDEIVEYWPIFSIDERPVRRYETRILCPRCDGEGHEPTTDDNHDNPITRQQRTASDLAF